MHDTQQRKATPENEDFRHKYEKTGALGLKLIENYFRNLQYLLRLVPETNITSALEVGCGEGYSTEKLQKMLPQLEKFEASEYVKEQVEVAQARLSGINIIQEDIYNLQRQDESFDLIFLLEVLEHLDEPKLALEELRRVSSRYLILGVPREPLWRMMNLARGHYIKDLGNTIGHLNHWSKNGIVKYVEKYFGRVIATRSPIPWTLVLAEKMYEA